MRLVTSDVTATINWRHSLCVRFQIAELKRIIADKNAKLGEANVRSDNQIMQIRVILDKSEREHQREMDAEIAKRDEFAGNDRNVF